MATKYKHSPKAMDGDKEIEEKKQELLKDLQTQITLVDASVTCWVNSFDSLRKSWKDLENDIISLEEGKENDYKTIRTKFSEGGLQLNKSEEGKLNVLKSLSRLIHFIHADRQEICEDEYLTIFKPLDIDKYLDDSSEENEDTLSKMLQKQNERLCQKYKLAREQVRIVREREKIVNTQRDKLQDQLTKLRRKMNNHTPENNTADMSENVNSKCASCQTCAQIVNQEQVTVKMDAHNDETEKEHNILSLRTKLEAVQEELNATKELYKYVDVYNAYDVQVICFRRTRAGETFLKFLQNAMKTKELKPNILPITGFGNARLDKATLISCSRDTKTTWIDVIKQTQSSALGKENDYKTIRTKCSEGGLQLNKSEEGKLNVLKSLSRLIHFIHADRQEICEDEYLTIFKPLDIDKYLDDSSEENEDTLSKMLQKQNERLCQKYKLAREQVRIVREREKIVNTQRDKLQDQLTKLRRKMNNHTPENNTADMSENVNSKCASCQTCAQIVNQEQVMVKMDAHNDETEKEHNILSLRTKLEAVQEELNATKELYKYVDVYNVYDVQVICFRRTRAGETFLKFLQNAMKTKELKPNILPITGFGNARLDKATLISCSRDTKTTWIDVIKQTQSSALDYESTAIVLLYDGDCDKQECEDAITKTLDIIKRYRKCFTLPYTKQDDQLRFADKEVLKEVIDFVVEKAVKKVVGCGKCSTSSTYV